MRGSHLVLTKALGGHMGHGAGLRGHENKGLMPQKEKLMTGEGKQPWEILPSLLLGQKITFK